jgi:competence protein ComEC
MKLFSALLAFTMILFYSCVAHAEEGKLRMHVINVGQAESILIEMPNHALLVDAGGEETERDTTPGSFYQSKLTEYLDDFFARNPHLNNTLYALILSHPHKDHTRYLEVILNRYRVQHFIEGGHQNGLSDLIDARQIVSQKGINRIRVKYNFVDSQQLRTWATDIEQRSGARVRFLSGRRGCNDENNDSLVMRIEYGQKSMMLTGDSEVDDRPFGEPNNEGCGGQLPYLLYRYRNNLEVLNADVYKVGHHGSPNGSFDKFLEAVSPEYAVISAGHYTDRSPGGFHGWQHGHPNERTIQLLERFVSKDRPQPVKVFTMKGQKNVIKNREVESGIFCTCWGNKAVVVTLSADATPIDVRDIPQ